MKTITIQASGPIYPDWWFWGDEPGISKERIQNQIMAAGDVDEIVIMIDSEGGQMQEGWKIYDYLLSLGKQIKTVILGQCCSMATIIFLTGTQRLISPNSTFMVHLPIGYPEGNRIEIQKYLDNMAVEEQKVIDVYVAATGKEESLIAQLMIDETFMTAQEAIDNGFATALFQTVTVTETENRQARQAIFCMATDKRPDKKALPPRPATPPAPTTNSNNMSAIKKIGASLSAGIASLIAIAGGASIVNMDVTLADGKTLVVDTTGDSPAVGDTVTIDGATAADGDYLTADNQTITVKDGAITEIKATENVADPDTAPTNVADPAVDPTAPTPEEITNLRNEVTRLKGVEKEFGDFKARTNTVVAQMQQALGMKVSQEPVIDSNKTPAGPKTEMSAQDKEQEMLKRREARLNKTSKK